jgi:hypothetical protein
MDQGMLVDKFNARETRLSILVKWNPVVPNIAAMSLDYQDRSVKIDHSRPRKRKLACSI